ncbi:hypothetical protein ASPWEDRAFT_116810 [Aspergillus wentii DTO 134E9]|uniref:Rhodopsin domain-containing protein n=1 Tax=Aspergillus wentii DTO 134E9 TaxID=1073089 RepID=A0A1L9RCB3_ASPWE|nr:uncharacterized protein ASPWEDRAFT_116810 [Aspergillus wentii DTO 134E9]OJJ32503.1 hypothetical protein ASPWEDRAFT_116810 [Aspergillus wentii DTO 134E9]
MADDGRSKAITVVTAVMLAISLTTVLLRCFVRLRVVKAFGWDDATMVAAMTLNLGFAICGLIGPKYGMGKKMTYFAFYPDHFHRALFCWWLGQVFYLFTCVMAKFSIIISLLRITIDRIHRYILYAAMGLTLLVGLLFFFFTVFQCQPVDFFWNRMSEKGTCINTDTLLDIAYIYSVGAAITDFTIGLLPIFVIWNLRMNPRAKVAIAGILGLGCIASAAVIVRIPYLHNYKSHDFLYATSNISIWSNIEAGLGITAGSLTTLRPLIRFLRDGSSASRSTPHTPGSFPLSSTFGHGLKSSKSRRSRTRTNPDDARHLWTGSHDEYTGTTTTVMGSHDPHRNTSEEELNAGFEPSSNPDERELKVERTFRVSVRNESP